MASEFYPTILRFLANCTLEPECLLFDGKKKEKRNVRLDGSSSRFHYFSFTIAHTSHTEPITTWTTISCEFLRNNCVHGVRWREWIILVAQILLHTLWNKFIHFCIKRWNEGITFQKYFLYISFYKFKFSKRWIVVIRKRRRESCFGINLQRFATINPSVISNTKNNGFLPDPPIIFSYISIPSND